MLRRALACVQSCQSLYCSRTCTKWAYILQFFQLMLRGDLVSLQSCQSLHCSRTIFCQPMLRRDLVCMQSSQSVHCSHTCAKWAYIRHIPSVNAQTSLSVCAVFQEPLLLTHMYKMGVYIAILSVNAQRRLSKFAVLPESSLLSHIHKMGVSMVSFISQCSNKP